MAGPDIGATRDFGGSVDFGRAAGRISRASGGLSRQVFQSGCRAELGGCGDAGARSWHRHGNRGTRACAAGSDGRGARPIRGTDGRGTGTGCGGRGDGRLPHRPGRGAGRAGRIAGPHHRRPVLALVRAPPRGGRGLPASETRRAHRDRAFRLAAASGQCRGRDRRPDPALQPRLDDGRRYRALPGLVRRSGRDGVHGTRKLLLRSCPALWPRGLARPHSGERGCQSQPLRGEVARFDAELAGLLASCFPEDPMAVPHRVWAVSGVRP